MIFRYALYRAPDLQRRRCQRYVALLQKWCGLQKTYQEGAVWSRRSRLLAGVWVTTPNGLLGRHHYEWLCFAPYRENYQHPRRSRGDATSKTCLVRIRVIVGNGGKLDFGPCLSIRSYAN